MKKILLGLVLGLASFAAIASTVDYGTYGVWNVKAWFRDNGTIINCAVQETTSDNITAMLWTGLMSDTNSIAGEAPRVHLKISHSSWHHTVGNPDVTDQIQVGNYTWNGTVYNPDPQSVDMNFALDDTFVPALSSNSYMTIHYSSNIDQQFQLNGLSQAWQSMVQCKANYGLQ